MKRTIKKTLREEFDSYLFGCYKVWNEVRNKKKRMLQVEKKENEFYEWLVSRGFN